MREWQPNGTPPATYFSPSSGVSVVLPEWTALMSEGEASTHDERAAEHLEAAEEEHRAAHEEATGAAAEVVDTVEEAVEAAEEAVEEAQEATEEAAERIEEEVHGAAEEHGIDYERLAGHVADELVKRGHNTMGEAPDPVAEPVTQVVEEATDPIRPVSEHWFYRPWSRFRR